MSFMSTYKPGQGRRARSFAAVLTVAVSAWCAYAFLEYGNSKIDRLFGASEPMFGMPLFGGDSPLTEWVTPILVLALAGFVGLVFWWRKKLNQPEVAEHLIGTELELRRVKWPDGETVWSSGSMVVFYTAWLALIIFILDLAMNTLVGVTLGQRFGEVGLGRILTGIGDFFGG